MSENDYIAEYIKERRPEIISSLDFVFWKMCRTMRNTLKEIAQAYNAAAGAESEGDEE